MTTILLSAWSKNKSFSSDFDEQKLQDYASSIDRSNPLSRLLIYTTGEKEEEKED